MKVLVVEDERRLARLIRRVLEEERYTVDEAHDGADGEELARAGAYDVIVLDVMLPGRDGVAVAENLRRGRVATPILMLTARDQVADRVRGLDAGADDYLVKPFAFAELLARLRSLSRRRTAELAPLRLTAADLRMDLARHEVTCGGRLVELTPKEYALLEYFLRHPGHVLTRTQILANVWRYDADVTSNVVDSYVHYLRDKIDRGQTRRLLHTVRGVRYVLRVSRCSAVRASASPSCTPRSWASWLRSSRACSPSRPCTRHGTRRTWSCASGRRAPPPWAPPSACRLRPWPSRRPPAPCLRRTPWRGRASSPTSCR